VFPPSELRTRFAPITVVTIRLFGNDLHASGVKDVEPGARTEDHGYGIGNLSIDRRPTRSLGAALPVPATVELKFGLRRMRRGTPPSTRTTLPNRLGTSSASRCGTRCSSGWVCTLPRLLRSLEH
jgi:hypothetical protein